VRILYFSRDYTTHDHRFLAVLSKTEHDVGFLRLERQAQQFDDRPIPSNIENIHWIGGSEPARIGNSLRTLSGVNKVIREFKPDLIQAGPIQRSALLVALSGFHPLVTMSWGYDLLVDVHRGSFWKWATRFTLKQSDALVADCNTIRKLAIQYGMANDRIVTFPWGANIHKYTPTTNKWNAIPRERLGWGKDAFVLISTRSWSDIYGVEDLARAFVQVARIHPEIRLLMLGNGPLAPKIRTIFGKGGVNDLVHFPGQISQDKLPEYFRAADIYISTSHSDGTSISMLEALASGTPVLLSDIPGNKEWVTKPAEVGWLFRDGDVDSLAQGIQYAVNNRNRLPQMGRAARQLAESRADWKLNQTHLFEAYKIALN
jgi:glycosyltransferase involved in cell wall biosynthesis